MNQCFNVRCKLCDSKFDNIYQYKEHIPSCNREQRIRELTKKAFMRHEETFRRLAEND